MSTPASFRTSTLCVTRQTAAALAYLARADAAESDAEPSPDGADALAESVLAAWIEREHPEVAERQRRVRRAVREIEREMRKEKQP